MHISRDLIMEEEILDKCYYKRNLSIDGIVKRDQDNKVIN